MDLVEYILVFALIGENTSGCEKVCSPMLTRRASVDIKQCGIEIAVRRLNDAGDGYHTCGAVDVIGTVYLEILFMEHSKQVGGNGHISRLVSILHAHPFDTGNDLLIDLIDIRHLELLTLLIEDLVLGELTEAVFLGNDTEPSAVVKGTMDRAEVIDVIYRSSCAGFDGTGIASHHL